MERFMVSLPIYIVIFLIYLIVDSSKIIIFACVFLNSYIMIKKLFEFKNFSLDFSSKLPVVNGSTSLRSSFEMKTLISLMIGKMFKTPSWHCVCPVINLVDNLPNREHMIQLLKVVYFYYKNHFVLDNTRFTVHVTSTGFYIADSLLVLFKVRDKKDVVLKGFTSRPSDIVKLYHDKFVTFYPICC